MVWKIDPNSGAIIARVKEIPNVVSLRLNDEEKQKIAIAQEILEQAKYGTTVKQLVEIGYIVIHDPVIGTILKTLFDNKRKNERLNVVDFV